MIEEMRRLAIGSFNPGRESLKVFPGFTYKVGPVDIVISIVEVDLKDELVRRSPGGMQEGGSGMDYRFATPSDFNSELVWTEKSRSFIGHCVGEAFCGETSEDFSNGYGTDTTKLFLRGM